MSAKTWEREIEYQLEVIKKAMMFMFEQGKNELLQARIELEKVIKKEVMLTNPMMALSAMENNKGLLVVSTMSDQLSEPLRRLDKKIAEVDTHIQALKGEDDSN